MTPNLDALTRRSVVFEHAYCQLSICAPSRDLRPVLEGRAEFVRNYSVTQYPRCDGPCKRVPLKKILVMGYTIRVRAFRFTEWYHWETKGKNTGRFGTISLRKAPIATELYHYDERLGHDFDSFEADNIAGQRGTTCLVKTLRATLQLFVLTCQHRPKEDACHTELSQLVSDLPRRCPRSTNLT